jgi:FdhD protein
MRRPWPSSSAPSRAANLPARLPPVPPPTLGGVSDADHQDAIAEAFVARGGGRPTEKARIFRVRNGSMEAATDFVAAEDPLEIRLGGEAVAVTMRTPAPGEDTELAVGFLVGEGILEPRSIAQVVECGRGSDGSAVDVRLRPGESAAPGWQRSFYATSSCGVCGKASLDAVRLATEPLPAGPPLQASVLKALPDARRDAQRVFERTGGLHAAGLFTAAGEPVVVREDVGRHNAVDKTVGRLALDGRLPANDLILQVSGRTSFEIVQKAALAGIPAVAAVSAPSSLAVDLAAELGMTLIGFSRDGGFNVYAGVERLAAQS